VKKVSIGAAAVLAGIAGVTVAQTAKQVMTDVKPVLTSDPVPHDPDDPAIWVHPTDPTRSVVVATDKIEKDGGLYVFGLDGKLRQKITPLDRPNNVDIEYGFNLRGKSVDIAVATERKRSRLVVYAIDGAGKLTDITGKTTVFPDAAGEAAAPMGIALFRRPQDGEIYAIVSRKEGPSGAYLGQYRLVTSADGKVDLAEVRRFGQFSGTGEIEAVAVDDALGWVYYSDEGAGIRKYAADPAAADANRELALFGTTGWEGDREGLAIWAQPDGTGYLVATDQIAGRSEFHVFPREGTGGRPHDQAKEIAIFKSPADETDGIEIVSAPLGPKFPKGLLVAMNSGPKNFLFFSWADFGLRPASPPSQRREGR